MNELNVDKSVEKSTRAFRLEQFQDYLIFERGLSKRTLSAYKHDLENCIAVSYTHLTLPTKA